MPMPTSRNTTYSAGSSPVKAADLNALQDMIIGNKKPALERLILPKFLFTTGTWNWTTGANLYVTSGGAATGLIEIPCEANDRITGITMNVFGDGAADCTNTVYYTTLAAQATTNLYSATDTNRAAAWGQLTLTPFTSQVLAVGSSVSLLVAPNAANYRIGNIRVFYDRL